MSLGKVVGSQRQLPRIKGVAPVDRLSFLHSPSLGAHWGKALSTGVNCTLRRGFVWLGHGIACSALLSLSIKSFHPEDCLNKAGEKVGQWTGGRETRLLFWGAKERVPP